MFNLWNEFLHKACTEHNVPGLLKSLLYERWFVCVPFVCTGYL